MVGRPRCGGETPLWWVPKGRWARSPFPSRTAETRDKFDHFGPLWWGDPAVVGRPRCGGETLGQKRPVSFQKRPFFGLPHNSRNSGQNCGGETPAVVGRPRCGGETPLWWGDAVGTSKTLWWRHVGGDTLMGTLWCGRTLW